MYKYISHLFISISLFSYSTAYAENVSTDKDNLISASIGLEYSTATEFDKVTLLSSFELSLSPKLKLGTELRKTEYNIPNTFRIPTLALTSFNLGYAFSDKAIIRAFLTDEHLSYLGMETYGISTSYTGKKYSISGYVARSSMDFIADIGAGSGSFDINGISASYNLSENFTVSAGIDNFIDPADANDITLSTIGGSYTFGKRKSVYITATGGGSETGRPEVFKIGFKMDFGKTGIQPFKSPAPIDMLIGGGG